MAKIGTFSKTEHGYVSSGLKILQNQRFESVTGPAD